MGLRDPIGLDLRIRRKRGQMCPSRNEGRGCRLTVDYYQVDDMRDPESAVQIINTVVTEAGNPGIQA